MKYSPEPPAADEEWADYLARVARSKAAQSQCADMAEVERAAREAWERARGQQPPAAR